MRTATIMRACIIGATAVFAWFLWNAGITWFNPGDGLHWLNGFHWGAAPVCVVIAMASAVAIARDYQPIRLFLFIILTSGLCFIAFALGRDELYALYGRSYLQLPTEFAYLALLPFIWLAIYGVVIAIGLTALASLLAPVRWWTASCLMGVWLLIYPLSRLTISVTMYRDIFDVIRLGYPVMWVTLLVPVALWCGRKSSKSRSDAP